MELNEHDLIEYACTKFEEEKYDEALDAFVLAYSKGIEREWILENIYNCYMAGNDAEFRKTYEQLQEKTGVSYEDCSLDFIPYREGEYYIFDAIEQSFLEKISTQSLIEQVQLEIFQEMEFSAAVLRMDWNWENVKGILAEAKNRKIYIICQDLKRCCSFFKLPELEECYQNVKLFDSLEAFQNYFHEHAAVYLPKIVLGDEIEVECLSQVIHEEHEYRLTPKGRNVENVLLTIAIPTRNRGNLVIERIKKMCESFYDAEIEFVISKNGTQLYQDEYKIIEGIADARINYFDHGKDLRIAENWHYAIEMAHGQYVLMVSDEDDVIWEAMEHYLKILNTSPQVCLVRARTSAQSSEKMDHYSKQGLDAFGRVFLGQNYLSGLIIKRIVFLSENLLRLEDIFSSNTFYQYYPHEFWCACMTRRGDYYEDSLALIDEKKSVFEEETKKYQQLGLLKSNEWIEEESGIPIYATYEERLKQGRGQVEFLRSFVRDNIQQTLMKIHLPL